jgi:hypothetical protein
MSQNRDTHVRAISGLKRTGLGVALAILAGAAGVYAQPVMVQTIGGGPHSLCGNFAGFAQGNTLNNSQFNLPYSCALDSAGDLWIADYNNGDVEEVTAAGNRSASITYEYVSGSNKHPFPNVLSVAVDSANNLYVLTTTELYEFANVTASFPNLNTLFQVPVSAFSSFTPTTMIVANDNATNIFIAFSSGSAGGIVRIPQLGNPLHNSFSTIVNNYSFAPSGMTIREDGQLAVCDTLHNGIYLVGTNAGSTPTLVTGGNGQGYVNGGPAFAQFNQPHGIAASADGRMVVCDTGNNYLRVIDTSFNTTALYGTQSSVWASNCSVGLYAGWVDGAAGNFGTNASGRSPYSVVISPSGTLFVTETYYDLLRSVTGSGLLPVTAISGGGGSTTNTATITTLAATSITTNGAVLNASVVPNGSQTTVYFEYGTNTTYGSNTGSTVLTTNLGASNSVSIPLSGLAVNTVIHYQAVAINAGGTSMGGDRSFITGSTSTSVLTLSPSYGYFPECETIMVTSSVPTIYYTEDGSSPSTNSPQVLIIQTNISGLYVGTFQWCNATNDLSTLQIATASGGVLSTVVTGTAAATNQLGFVRSPSVGIGSVAYVPIVLDLQPGTTVKSLDFRVEVNPTTTNKTTIASLSMLPITTNDFVQFLGPAPGNAPVTFDFYAYNTSSNGQGLLVSALGADTGLDIQNFGVVGLLRIPIPYNATTNESYTLNILYPSATSDGLQNNVPLAPMASQTLLVADLPYLAGDSSPADGYNAGEFGDGYLENADVNNAIYASMGIRIPPVDSDAYNAMDVYPQTPSENGDGLIQFQDWNTILLRQEDLQAPNWIRFWTNNGFLAAVTTLNGVIGGPPAVTTDASSTNTGPPPGQVWLCPASINGGILTNQAPGSVCSVPVYANVLHGYSLAGFQFRAIVSGDGNAPAVGALSFAPYQGINWPYTYPGLSPNDILAAWPLSGGLSKPLTNTNCIGYLSFQIPSTAQPGQSYSIHFQGVDGAGDTNSDYAMESFPATVWVQSAAKQARSLTSDEWKLHFFGSLTSPAAADNVDADGDGASNWQEYLAGTDPTNASSALQFGSPGLSTNGTSGVGLIWLTAPGKTYILQSISAFGGNTWTSINTNLGDGYYYQFIQSKYNGSANFYRILLKP